MNIIVLFAPNARGNFVKNCLTFSNNTADATYKNTHISNRLRTYVHALNTNSADEPAHIDDYNNYSEERILNADYADNYIHCGHVFELPQWDEIETMAFNNKHYIVITTTQGLYNDYNFIDRFTKTTEWYNLPYADILIKEVFLEHCKNINNQLDLNLVSDYYDMYYKKSLKNTSRRDIRYNM